MKERTYELNARREPSLDPETIASEPDGLAGERAEADHAVPLEPHGDNLVAAELVAPELPARGTGAAVIGPIAGQKLARIGLFAGGVLLAMVVGAGGAMWLMDYQQREHAAELSASGANAAVVQSQPGAIAPTEAAAADPADFLEVKPDNRPPIVTLPPDAAAVAAAAAAKATRAVPVDDTSKTPVLAETGAPVTVTAATPAPRVVPARPAPKPVVGVIRQVAPALPARVVAVKPAPAKPAVAKAVAVPAKAAKPAMAGNIEATPTAKAKSAATLASTPLPKAPAKPADSVANARAPAKSPPKIPLIGERAPDNDADQQLATIPARAPERATTDDSQARALPAPRSEGRVLPPPRDAVRDDAPPPRRCPPGALARECAN